MTFGAATADTNTAVAANPPAANPPAPATAEHEVGVRGGELPPPRTGTPVSVAAPPRKPVE